MFIYNQLKSYILLCGETTTNYCYFSFVTSNAPQGSILKTKIILVISIR